ncbi:MMPL family transporter [Streptomyces sp. AV19]|uniref:MMPL family transporter n=1 Tax=Streptomyces sp. AV19 TaxID=2793068 RepID=UPI0018FEADE5|nr:MMPL family transporter [Streptomyces sp. AV19]MBH1938761.1 MMPL family transporter [Streptomyces sp. AV19]MDG4533964.1 MMPL family transporter [Streptomyces sp. AV19]
MLTRLARLAINRPKSVLVGALLAVVACGVLGVSVLDRFKEGGFVPSDAGSARASRIVDTHFTGVQPNLIVALTADDGADGPAARRAGGTVTEWMSSHHDIGGVRSYWQLGPRDGAALRSKDGRTALITARIDADDTDLPKTSRRIKADMPRPDGVTVRVGGYGPMTNELNSQTIEDATVGEAVAFPVSLVVLVVVFGSLVAAALPLLVGAVSIVTTLAILRLVTGFADVSVYALNMTTLLGLALGIDYSLFIVSRFREELRAGRGLDDAVLRTVRTAGRTVVFSGVTVALALAALIVFPVFFLKSFAYVGIAVVLVAVLTAVLVLPAALALLGHRVDRLDVRVPLRRLFRLRPPHAAADVAPERTRWYRMVVVVTRRAVPVAVVTVAGLLLLGAPFLSSKWGYPDDRVISASVSEARQVGDLLREDFAEDASAATTVVLPGFDGGDGPVAAYATGLSRVPGVSEVVSGAGTFVHGAQAAPASAPASRGLVNEAGAVLRVGTAVDPYSADGKRLLSGLREVPAPGERLLAGAAAENEDVLDALADPLPLAAGLMALAMFVLLFLFTGSLVLPLKALVMNALSLGAAFGAMVWVFQEGHLSGLLGFTATGYLVANVPVLMFCVAFGLSMDYEVFLLARIREEWLVSGRATTEANTHAVALGVARTGRVFTAAALLMAIVLVGMGISKVSFLQMCGLGLALTVLVDAVFVRCLLAPAMMRLLGRFNWWAPAGLRRVHARIGLAEEAVMPASAAAARGDEAR